MDGAANEQQNADNESTTKANSGLLPELFHRVYQQSRGKIMQPTPIQLQTWPILLSGKCNLLGIAPTSSGKTLAYGLPMVRACLNAVTTADNDHKYKVNNGPLGLILAPTRELAVQIAKDISKVGKCANQILSKLQQEDKLNPRSKKSPTLRKHKFNVMAVYGGIKREEHMAAFQPGEPLVHIMAATPGRLLDMIGLGEKTTSSDGNNSIAIANSKKRRKKQDNNDVINIITLNNVCCLVLDEADRMLQMGFREQIDALSERIRPDRLTSLFSASFPQRLSEACADWIPEPAVSVKASIIKLGQVDNTNKNDDKKIKAPKVEETVTKAGPTIQANKDSTRDTKSFSLIVGNLSNKNNTQDSKDDDDNISNADSDDDENDPSTATGLTKDDAPPSRVTEVASIPSHVAQILHVCASHKKPKKLAGTLRKLRDAEREQEKRRQGLLIVFFSTIKNLKYMAKLLRQEGMRCMELHGQMPQQQREKTLHDFKAGKFSTMLATDIAARGIHVNNVEYVVNYDFPGSVEQYVHRCGRAGRTNNNKVAPSNSNGPKACVYSFFTRDFAPMAKDMLAILKQSKAWIDPNLVALVEKGNGGAKKKGKKVVKQDKQQSANADIKTGSKTGSPLEKKEEEEDDDVVLDCDDGQFSSLMGNRIVLKRSAHVSDAEDSSSSSDEEE